MSGSLRVLVTVVAKDLLRVGAITTPLVLLGAGLVLSLTFLVAR